MTVVAKTKSFKCYASHPVIELGGGEIMGGSCIHPAEGYDAYIGFDRGMSYQYGSYPWRKTKTPVEFLFKIVDMGVPEDLDEFKLMLKWIDGQLSKGKRIHMGCIGGHGRTGLVLSALINQISGVEDSTTWVRDNYCPKAVESAAQVKWLYKHFGINKVPASKTGHVGKVVTFSGDTYSKNECEIIPHIESDFCIW